ncbi:hypothetical protein ACFQFS_02885 [Novosphingobium lubricantis]|jgi:hypothetical protein
MKKVMVACAVVLAAFVVLAWIKGGTQPMRWIEEPVSVAAVQP